MRIHYHSDCRFFAGCEMMLVNFFHDERLRKEFDINFSYRKSSDYQRGLEENLKTQINLMPLRLLDLSDAISRIRIRPLQVAAKILSYLLGIRVLAFLWNTLLLYRTFGRQRIDLLHINNGGYPAAPSCQAAVLAAKLHGVKKIIYIVNNFAYPYQSWSRRLGYPLDRFIAKTVSIFVATSKSPAESLVKVLKLRAERVTIIHNGIGPRRVTEEKERVLKRLGIPSNKMVFAVVSLLEKRKGHIHLLKALEHLKNNRHVSRLPLVLIEGKGPERESLSRFVRATGLEDSVKFIGSEENIFNLLNAIDVLVETSIAHSPTPNVVTEGMSLGKVVIASCWSSSEQIEHCKNGILCDPRNTKELSDAIRQVVMDLALKEKLAQDALKTFKEKFTASKAVENYCQLYGNLLGV